MVDPRRQSETSVDVPLAIVLVVCKLMVTRFNSAINRGHPSDEHWAIAQLVPFSHRNMGNSSDLFDAFLAIFIGPVQVRSRTRHVDVCTGRVCSLNVFNDQPVSGGKHSSLTISWNLLPQQFLHQLDNLKVSVSLEFLENLG